MVDHSRNVKRSLENRKAEIVIQRFADERESLAPVIDVAVGSEASPYTQRPSRGGCPPGDFAHPGLLIVHSVIAGEACYANRT